MEPCTCLNFPALLGNFEVTSRPHGAAPASVKRGEAVKQVRTKQLKKKKSFLYILLISVDCLSVSHGSTGEGRERALTDPVHRLLMFAYIYSLHGTSRNELRISL